MSARVQGLAVLALALAVAAACEPDPEHTNLPSRHTANGPPSPRFAEGSAGTTPVFTKVRAAVEVERRIQIQPAGGGGGGGATPETAAVPPSFPAGQTLSPDEALAASRAARSVTGSSRPCELAYEAQQEVSMAFYSKTPSPRTRPGRRAAFIETCSSLPEINQWCMVPSYLATHGRDCDARARTRFARFTEGYEAPPEAEAEEAAGGETPAGPTPAGPAQLGPTRAGATPTGPTPAGATPTGATPAGATTPEAPTMGPRRITPPRAGDDEDEEGGGAPCPSGNCPH